MMSWSPFSALPGNTTPPERAQSTKEPPNMILRVERSGWRNAKYVMRCARCDGWRGYLWLRDVASPCESKL